MVIKRTVLAYVHDLIMTGLSVVAAVYLRLGTHQFFQETTIDILLYAVPVFVLTAAVAFRMTDMYRGIWRYASVADLVNIIKGVTLLILIAVPILFFLTRLENYPRSVPIIQWFLLVTMLGGPRFLYRWLRDQRFIRYKQDHVPDETKKHVLLFGADSESEIFIRACVNNFRGEYVIVGILDPKGNRAGRSMLGVPIYGYHKDKLPEILTHIQRRYPKPQMVIFTNGDNEETDVVRDIDAWAETEGMTLGRLPSLTEFQDAQNAPRVRIKPIPIEDLLGRPQTHIDLQSIKNLVKDCRVLVTGAGGTIGSELVRQIAAFHPSSMMLVDHAEYNLYAIDQEMADNFTKVPRDAVLCDVRDRDRLFRLFEQFKPDLVFHAAALKHVPMVQMNPEEGILTNFIGTMNVADAAAKFNVRAMVQISTDKAVNPTNVMGASKRLAEFYCQSLDLLNDEKSTRFVTVRFGNVLGSSGSVVPLFRKQLERGGPLTVTHPEIKRYFMTVQEAVRLVLQASSYGISNAAERGEIFVLDMGEPMKIVDVARKMIRLAGLEPDKDIAITFTGLRPGEKLYEELFDTSEQQIQTEIPAILAAKPQAIEIELLRKSAQLLQAAARQGDVDAINQHIALLVSGYDPQDYLLKRTQVS